MRRTLIYFLLIFASLCAHHLHAQNIVRGERPTGQIRLKVAVMNYEPRFPYINNRPYWDVCGWTNPRDILPMIFNAIEEATDGQVIMELVHWADVNMFPYGGRDNRHGARRYTPEQYYYDWHGGWPSDMIDAKLDREGYYMALTNDFPHIIPMVNRGEVDHVIMFGGPYFGYWETQMVGEGAYWCNSSPITNLTERLFVINGMNVERPGSGLHNYGHGLGEHGLGAWFSNRNIVDYNRSTHSPFTNMNDYILFTRVRNNLGGELDASPIHVGNTHYTPNSVSGYEYNNNRDWVKCYADQWYDYPLMIATGRMMRSGSPNSWYWTGEREDDAFQKWFWNHVPRYMGSHFAAPTNRFRKGHMNNWFSYIFNPSFVGYPLGSGHTVSHDDTDMRGWYAYRIEVPTNATDVTIHISSDSEQFKAGIRKDFLPYLRRYNSPWHGNVADDEVLLSNESHTWTLTETHNYGKGLHGVWYLTLGGSAEPYSNFVTHAHSVLVTITPTPTNTTPPAITFTAPQEHDVLVARASRRTPVTWTIDGLPQGVRASYLAWRPSPTNEWIPVAEDYVFNFDGEYFWELPTIATDTAQLKLIIEDVYGLMHTHYSDVFTLNPPIAVQPTSHITAEKSISCTIFNNTDVSGTIVWSNDTTGVHGSYAAHLRQHTFTLPLALNTNTLYVHAATTTGSNILSMTHYIRRGSDFVIPEPESDIVLHPGDTLDVAWENGWMGPLGGSNILAWSSTGLNGPWSNLAHGAAHNTLTNYLFTAPDTVESENCYFRVLHYTADVDAWSTNYSERFTVVPEPALALPLLSLLLFLRAKKQ